MRQRGKLRPLTPIFDAEVRRGGIAAGNTPGSLMQQVAVPGVYFEAFTELDWEYAYSLREVAAGESTETNLGTVGGSADLASGYTTMSGPDGADYPILSGSVAQSDVTLQARPDGCTLVAMIYVPSGGPYSDVIVHRRKNESNNDTGHRLSLNSGRLEASVAMSEFNLLAQQSYEPSVTMGEGWHLVEAFFPASGNPTLYIDGTAVTVSNAGGGGYTDDYGEGKLTMEYGYGSAFIGFKSGGLSSGERAALVDAAAAEGWI